MADSVLAGARSRDVERFTAFFSARPEFTYLINTRRFEGRDAIRTAFHDMLARQARFEPQWTRRDVTVLSATSGVFVGEFHTEAMDMDGDEWQVDGIVTFVAMLEPAGWRIINWHTSE